MSEMTCRACGKSSYVESWSIPYNDRGEEVGCAWCGATMFVVEGAAAHRVYKSYEEKLEADARVHRANAERRHSRWRNW